MRARHKRFPGRLPCMAKARLRTPESEYLVAFGKYAHVDFASYRSLSLRRRTVTVASTVVLDLPVSLTMGTHYTIILTKKRPTLAFTSLLTF